MTKDTKQEIERTGIPTAESRNVDREITRSIWLEEVFPEWQCILNREIAEFKVEDKTFALWWFGGPSWAYKSPGGAVFLIDNYAGPSLHSEYHYCGVCRTAGSPYMTWLRTHPQVVDPWAFETLDAVFATHHHQDHADIYTVKAALQTTEAKFIGPHSACELFRQWQVPEDRIIQVKPGDSFNIKDVEIAVEKNYDPMATMTGDYKPGDPLDYDKNVVSFLTKNEGGCAIFLGDTLYSNGYHAVGERHQIDVAIMNMGHNAPGMTDKMSPFDAFRVGQALGTKVIIPDHYENWASSEIDPQQLVDIVKKNDPGIKTVILKHGARFIYPADQDIGEYKYPDWRERFNWSDSWEYGTPIIDK